MRLRNIPRAAEVVWNHRMVIRDPFEHRGNWRQLFGNDQPLHIEIGMGKGQFLLQMARLHPSVNYIGVERYHSVLLRALEKFDTEEFKGLENIRFLCVDAARLPKVFVKGEIAKIYLNFSDPWPKAKHAKRRLTSNEFLVRYEQILADGGALEFKTDNTGLFQFSLDQIQNAKAWNLNQYTFDLHREEEMKRGNVMTEYEQKFSAMGNPIHKLIASLKMER